MKSNIHDNCHTMDRFVSQEPDSLMCGGGVDKPGLATHSQARRGIFLGKVWCGGELSCLILYWKTYP